MTAGGPRTIADRAGLVAELRRAASVEHDVICRYLFAAFSMKTHPEEGVSWEQLERMRGWRAAVQAVAREEMAHLGIVCNMLTALGALPHFTRAGGNLEPFGEDALAEFIRIERDHADEGREVDTIGAMYGRIRDGFERAASENPCLFAGAPDAQVDNTLLHLPAGWHDVDLFRITDEASASEAVDRVVESSRGSGGAGNEGRGNGGSDVDGRGPPAEARRAAAGPGDGSSGAPDAEDRTSDRPGSASHAERFEAVLGELGEERRRDPGFEPARPVAVNPTVREAVGAPIRHPVSRSAAELFNAAYETMLLLLVRLYAPAGERPDERASLVRIAFLPLMTMVIRPLGEMLTAMPLGEDGEASGGMASDRGGEAAIGPSRGEGGDATADASGGVVRYPRAGPTFECGADPALAPNPPGAWILLQERFDEMARRSALLAQDLRALDVPWAVALAQRAAFLEENLHRVARTFGRSMNVERLRTQLLLRRLT